jgi:catechol 2,3-dioxygenase-like lactoylglutathione lyase family enzyme
MIDHLDITVSDLVRSEVFYLRALAPLGFDLVYRNTSNAAGGQTLGFSTSPNPTFCIRSGERPTTPVHIAFSADSRAAVDAFHAAALAVGGVDNGAPGLRLYYANDYYSAFVLDPDGHNVEAVCRRGL